MSGYARITGGNCSREVVGRANPTYQEIPCEFGYHSGKELMKLRAKANKIWLGSFGGGFMERNRLTALVMAAALITSGAVTRTSAHDRRAIHPPIYVATPTGRSPITPYFYPYGSRYRYNSPGPVYYHLDYWGPEAGCRLWRYNYRYWICG